jgi:intracellular septation protein A
VTASAGQGQEDTAVQAPDSDVIAVGPSPALAQPSAVRVMSSLAPSLVINGVCPIILYQLLTGHGAAAVPALVAGSVFPLADTLWTWVRNRRLDLIAGISLFFIVLSAAASLISGSTRFSLVKESFFTGLFGLVMFGSLLASRPLMFYMIRQLAAGGDAELGRQWDDRWQYPGFRHAMRVMTAMWGVMFVADALIRVGLVFILSTSVFLVASQVLFYTMFAATMLVSTAYGRRSQRKAMAQMRA